MRISAPPLGTMPAIRAQSRLVVPAFVPPNLTLKVPPQVTNQINQAADAASAANAAAPAVPWGTILLVGAVAIGVGLFAAKEW